MSDSSTTATGPRRPPETNTGTIIGAGQIDNKKLLDALIFNKDLNEVHLLIDLISGRADRSLSTLTMRDPDDPTKTLASEEILKRITLMRYPPEDGDAVNASNAAILLMAKDRLTALADPARGQTIAYTMMFTDAEPRTLLSQARSWIHRKYGRAASIRPPDTGIDLAIQTFPGLQAHARRFRVYRTFLGWLALFWLVLTALTFWDASLGRSALDHADQNWKAYIDAARDAPLLVDQQQGCDIDALVKQIKAVQQPVASDPNKPVAPPAAETTQALNTCRKLHYLKEMTEQSNDEINNVFSCAGMNHSALLHVWCWRQMLVGRCAAPGEGCTVTTNDHDSDSIRWQQASSTLSVFTGYVLPMMFALLGTLIGAFRAILSNLGNSSLAPRDMVGMILGIPAGLVAGIAVGLFLSPSSTPAQGAGGVGGAFTLTASGLGFVAGYASQSFFTYLDNIVRTIFPAGSTTNARAAAIAAAQAGAPVTVMTGGPGNDSGNAGQPTPDGGAGGLPGPTPPPAPSSGATGAIGGTGADTIAGVGEPSGSTGPG